MPLSRLLRSRQGCAAEVAEIKDSLCPTHCQLAASANERALAREIVELRGTLTELMSGVTSCSSCAEGYRGVEGTFHGGLCCSGTTADVFRDYEVDLLRLSGAKPRHYKPATGPDAGCAFRGAHGCSLPSKSRPTYCTHYVCRTLMAELSDIGVAVEVGNLQAKLTVAMQGYRHARDQRIADEEITAGLPRRLRHAYLQGLR